MATSMMLLRRTLALMLGAVVLCAQMHWRAHSLKVAHATCEHGEIIHIKASGPDDRPASVNTGAANPSDVHDHGCSMLLLSRTPVPGDATGLATDRPPTGRCVPRSSVWTPRTTFVRLAAARAPPA